MQKLKHNKKRNTGLLYEFFTRYIGKAILENRDSDILKSKTLLKKHFNKSTDIYKELKLVKALTESNVSSREQAIHIINRVREAVKYQSQARLDLEKTSLIHEINSNLNSEFFFEEVIPAYKQLATVQVLLNTWRDETLKEAITETVQLEERLIEFMMESKVALDKTKETASMTTEDVDRLVVNIMTEKVNKKYSNLEPEQKEIIQLYVFSKENLQMESKLVEKLEKIKGRFISTLSVHQHEFETDKVLSQKLQEIKITLQKEYNDPKIISEDLVSFYLGLSKLEGEVKAK
ncbi:MAG: hypothetical protein WCO04_19465 [Pseudomonadota bacterium]|jgi:hypothetical protein